MERKGEREGNFCLMKEVEREGEREEHNLGEKGERENERKKARGDRAD